MEKKLETKKEIVLEKEIIDVKEDKQELQQELEKETNNIIEEKEPPFQKEHSRVSEWFTNSEKRLGEDYSTCGSKIKKLMIKFHAFTKKVDTFIFPIAIKCSWFKNGKDLGSVSYNIPAELYDLETGERFIGTISYGIDKDGLLFHRCFSKKIPDEIQEIVCKHIDSSLPHQFKRSKI